MICSHDWRKVKTKNTARHENKNWWLRAVCLQMSRFGGYWLYIQYSAWYRYTCPVPWPPPLLSAVHCLTRVTRGTRVPTQATAALTHTLFHSFYNVIYSSDKPRFLKMCVSATVSELLSVICLIWYVPASEVLLQLWRILRCSSLREILCAVLNTGFLLTLFVEDDLVITDFDIYHIFWGGKSYKLPLKVQEKLDYSARSSVLVTNFCSAPSLWFWHFRPSPAHPQPRPSSEQPAQRRSSHRIIGPFMF